MLSVARCRQVLGPGCTLSDGEVERIRDDLYAFARIAVERVAKSGTYEAPITAGDVILSLTEASRVDVMERAAIIEFDGGRPRDEAERLAVAGVVGRPDARKRNGSGGRQPRRVVAS